MNNNNTTTIVGAIILAGLIIAGAIIYSQKPASNSQTAGLETGNQPNNNQPTGEPVAGHLLGNPDAEITLTLYSDIECPYCKLFHETMEQTMDTYGKDGKIKWVYKHYPIAGLHPTAPKESEATECVAELAGDEKFFTYLKDLTENQVKTNDLKNDLATRAEKLGIDKNKFVECYDSGKYASKIQASSQEAVSLGARGTPFSIIETKSGKKETLPGYIPFEDPAKTDMKEVIEELLGN